MAVPPVNGNNYVNPADTPGLTPEAKANIQAQQQMQSQNMAEQMAFMRLQNEQQRQNQSQLRDDSDSSRLLPLAIAGMCCFLIAVLMGTVSWYFLYLPNQSVTGAPAPETLQNAVIVDVQTPEPDMSASLEPEPVAVPVAAPPDGTVDIPGSEVVLSSANRPVERTLVNGFAIAVTEVTNAEYADFIRESGHTAPPGWSENKFPAETGDFPVASVSWKDAVAFCEWKSGKLGLPVRLPTEAEWELAARGPEQRKYPWGAEWNKDAAISKETGGKVSAVKSFPLNVSSLGAYDMVGNVWEWVADDVDENEPVSDAHAEAARKEGKRLRIVKGASAEEPSKDMDAQARYEVPESTKVKVIGFRYVVNWRKAN